MNQCRMLHDTASMLPSRVCMNRSTNNVTDMEDEIDYLKATPILRERLTRMRAFASSQLTKKSQGIDGTSEALLVKAWSSRICRPFCHPSGQGYLQSANQSGAAVDPQELPPRARAKVVVPA